MSISLAGLRPVSSPLIFAPGLIFPPVFLRIRAINDIYFAFLGNAMKMVS